ncbi:alcohol oxidase [Trametes polyzona]|nr:alcohol oxidase [Trametes polyzona]
MTSFARLLAFTAAVCSMGARAALFTDPTALPSGKVYDYIVIGSGPGGGTVAARLSENPSVNVLVIEAGITDVGAQELQIPLFAPNLVEDSPYNWNYTTVPQPELGGRQINYARGKVLGGSSSINWMFWTRGPQDDYDKYAEITGDEGWSWDAIQPFWQKALRIERLVPPTDGHDTTGEIDPSIHGHNGAINISTHNYPFPPDASVIGASHELGGDVAYNEDFNSGNPLGLGWFQGANGGGIRSSSATAYLHPASSRTNLDVLIQTQVTKLIQTGTDGDTPVFRGVRFAQSPSAPTFTLTATREVILSAGAINTPQLLMLSGLGPTAHLSSLGIPTIVDIPSVGQNLSDHPAVPLPYSVLLPPVDDVITNIERDPVRAALALAQWEATRSGVLANSGTNQIAFVRVPANDSVFESVPDPSSGPTAPHLEFLAVPGYPSFLGNVPATGGYTAFGGILIAPTSRGTITLASASPFAAPLIDPAFLSTAFDRAALRAVMRAVARFAAAPAWTGFLTGRALGFEDVDLASDAALDAWASAGAFSIWHPAGTAAMAACGAAEGVVGPDLRVKGVEGLRVVDASVFPFVPAAHPQAMIYAFAERAAELIKNGTRACSN